MCFWLHVWQATKQSIKPSDDQNFLGYNDGFIGGNIASIILNTTKTIKQINRV